MSTKIPVWPGPRVMVPMATDVLLVGQPDIPQPGDINTGTPLSSTRADYFDLFLKEKGRMLQDDAFNVTDSKSHLEAGAHLMWTLPHGLRKGKQVADGHGGAETEFPEVPNRWLITRFEYADINSGDAPKVSTQMVLSDVLEASAFPAEVNTSLYPVKTGNYPASKIGATVPLANWEGDVVPAANRVKVQAIGPGKVSWSVTYDNVRNVFGFHDANLSNKATKTAPYVYSYLIVGWYSDPAADTLVDMPTSAVMADGAPPPVEDPSQPSTASIQAWSNALEARYGWSLGQDGTAVPDALVAWADWQKAHGLDGPFDPTKINLSPEAKAAIIAWQAWQTANGSTKKEPALALQLLCHSHVSNVVWKGTSEPYASGSPQKSGEYPTLAVGNTAVEAISTYMADLIVKSSSTPQVESDIPVIARALESFQKDLLYDYMDNPVQVENLLHETHFTKTPTGKEWIVVRSESSDATPSTNAGKQSIPLSNAQTNGLTAINQAQRKANELAVMIITQSNEFRLLNFKESLITSGDTVPSGIKSEVTQSIQALNTVLTTNKNEQSGLLTTISQKEKALRTSLGEDYILRDVDLPTYNTPNDPVIMVAGAQLDPKLGAGVTNLDDQVLPVRYTGQFLTALEVKTGHPEITATQLLAGVDFPAWKAFPKEVVSLWVESLLLDPTAASFLASTFLKEINGPPADLSSLTKDIRNKQQLIWQDTEAEEFPREALFDAAGFIGTPPPRAAAAYRIRQPWTPIFMDWSVRWVPTSPNSSAPFTKWALGEIDYQWEGQSIPEENAVELTGRSILNPGIAQVIQGKLEGFANDSNYDDLEDWLKKDLAYSAGQISKFDILTQSITGFTESLITKLTAARLEADTGNHGGQGESYVPQLVSQMINGEQQYAPIRSGHFQLRNVWVIDAFGQIMYSAPNPTAEPPKSRTPLTNVKWSESLTTPVKALAASYGQLSPRLSQPAAIRLDLLQKDDDTIISNSADATSPICGWVMPNHLDNSLMVFDAAGENIGAVIKVQSEKTNTNWSVRWDAAPGLNTPLGAPPQIKNLHLAAFINGLIHTGYTGAEAYEDLLAAIDSTLWTQTTRNENNSNLSLLVGKPLAVVRADVSLRVAGAPIYQQGWTETGKYYNKNGVYSPTSPPYLSVPFSLRIGDAQLNENGVMGYFADDDYDTFYAVYGSNGGSNTDLLFNQQTAAPSTATSPTGGHNSGYVKEDHLVTGSINDAPTKLTVLMDPSGILPVFSGSTPFRSQSLPNGPVSAALSNLAVTFRVGPVLLDPKQIKMPLPDEVRGKWSWLQRQDVTSWETAQELDVHDPTAALSTNPLRLSEGWLRVGAESNKK